MNSSSTGSTVIILILLVIAFLTNPTDLEKHKQAYEEYFQKHYLGQSNENSDVQNGLNELNAIGNNINLLVQSPMVKDFMSVKNYYVFSLTQIGDQTIGIGAFGNVWINEGIENKIADVKRKIDEAQQTSAQNNAAAEQQITDNSATETTTYQAPTSSGNNDWIVGLLIIGAIVALIIFVFRKKEPVHSDSTAVVKETATVITTSPTNEDLKKDEGLLTNEDVWNDEKLEKDEDQLTNEDVWNNKELPTVEEVQAMVTAVLQKSFDKYYFHDGREKIGPIASDNLKDLGIKSNWSVWKEGMADWKPVTSLPELRPFIKTEPPVFTKTGPPEFKQATITAPIEKTNSKSSFWLYAVMVLALILFVAFIYYTSYRNRNISSVEVYKSENIGKKITTNKKAKSPNNDLSGSAIADNTTGGSNNLIPYTNNLRQEYNWNEEQLRNMHFVISQSIILHRKMDNGGNERYDLHPYNKGKLIGIPNENKFLISFGGSDYLSFGGNPKAEGKYVILASDWYNGIGKVHFGNNTYDLDSNSNTVFLLIDPSELATVK